MLLILLSLSLVMWMPVQHAQARLGETEVQCAARYGTILKQTDGVLPGSVVYTYEKKDMNVVLVIMGGKCVKIEYSWKDNRDLSRDVIDTLLHCNVGQSSWIMKEGDPVMVRQDYKAICFHNNYQNLKKLVIGDYAHNEAEMAVIRARKNGLEDF